MQPAPSSHERSPSLHRLATSASLPCEASVGPSAECGTPRPVGLPAIERSKAVAVFPPCEARTVSAPSESTDASISNGRDESIVRPAPHAPRPSLPPRRA